MPSIIDIQIDWMDGYINDPRITLLLDAEPDFSVYAKYPCQNGREQGHLYVSRDHDLANFFYWAKPDDGFGGWDRLVYIDDGSVERLIGGWSSRASVASEITGVELVDCAYVTKRQPDGKLGGGMRVSVTHDALWKALNRLQPRVDLCRGLDNGAWTVKWAGQPAKHELVARLHKVKYSEWLDGAPLGF